MYFNSANNRSSLDPRRSADYGWDVNSLEPEIGKSSGKLWSKVPPMVASFDLETTGLNNAEPISFGMAIFRDGKLSDKESQHFLIQPNAPIEEGAFETHGWTDRSLEQHRYGAAPSTEPQQFSSVETTMPESHLQAYKQQYASNKKNSNRPFEDRYDVTPSQDSRGMKYVTVKHKQVAPALTQEDIDLPPAVPLGIGINKIVGIMSNLQKQGFVFLGANPTYDTKIIQSSWERENGSMPVQITGFNPDSMRLIDVIKHDHSIEPPGNRNMPGYRSRSLTNLAQHYGVEAGGHRALHDSIAAGRVFIEGQVPKVQKMMEERGGSTSGIRLSSVEASSLGIEWGMGGPCFGTGCGFCSHLGEVALSHTDPLKAERVNYIMQMHQGMQGENNA